MKRQQEQDKDGEKRDRPERREKAREGTRVSRGKREEKN